MEQKTIFITGASRGIGKSIALLFASRGYHTFLNCSSSVDELKKLRAYITEKYHTPCTLVPGNVGNPDHVRAIYNKIYQECTHLDVLVNNAGISYIGLLSDLSVEDWQRLMDVNLNAAFYTSRLAIPMMLHKHSGRIINISSVWGSVGASMEVAYSTSKGGLNAFTKALSKELAPSGIQVNAVACGVIDTDMNKCFSEDEREALIGEIPADRMGQPEEIAQTVLQLINAPSYLTGQIITVDGGWI